MTKIDMSGLYTYLEGINARDVQSYDFYRTMFPKGALQEVGKTSDGKYNAVICLANGKRIFVHDDLYNLPTSEILGASMNCIAYAGNCDKPELGRELYAFAFRVLLPQDQNHHYVEGKLRHIFERHRYKSQAYREPRIGPTYIALIPDVGIWFYYILRDPIPLYKSLQKKIHRFYTFFSREIHRCFDDGQWARSQYVGYACKKPRPKGIFEAFPVVGTSTEGGLCVAYRTGNPYTLQELNEVVGESVALDYEPPKPWIFSASMYESFVQRVKDNINIVKLSVFDAHAANAKKCAINDAKFQSDQEELLNLLKSRFSMEELCAAKDNANSLLYDETQNPDGTWTDNSIQLYGWSTEKIEWLSGLTFPRGKRNGRTQKQHLSLVHRKLSKEKAIRKWRKDNPDGTKAECHRETDISRPTIDKWWEPKVKTPKQKKVTICPSCGEEVEMIKREATFFWEHTGNPYKRNDQICPACGAFHKGRARIDKSQIAPKV